MRCGSTRSYKYGGLGFPELRSPMRRPISRVEVGRVGMPQIERLDRQLAVVGAVEIRGQRLDLVGHADNETARWHILRYHRARGDETSLADFHAGHEIGRAHG